MPFINYNGTQIKVDEEGFITDPSLWDEDLAAFLSFNVDGMEAGIVGTLIDVDHNNACRTGLHCAPLVHDQLGTAEIHGAVRFGIGPFNTKEHIQSAIEAVRETAAFANR